MIEVKQKDDQAKNAERVTGSDQEPCYICGRAVTTSGKNFFWVEVTGGGKYVERIADLDTESAGYVGSFPVGPGCYRSAGLTGYGVRAH